MAPHLYAGNVTEYEVDVIVAPRTDSHGMLISDRRGGKRGGAGRPSKPRALLMLDVDGEGFLRHLAAGIARLGVRSANGALGGGVGEVARSMASVSASGVAESVTL